MDNKSKSMKPYPQRLQEAVKMSYKMLEPVRQTRYKMMSLYANGFYGGDMAGRQPLPLNLIDRGIQIILPFLVSQNPRVKISPKNNINNPYVKPFANTLELALDHLFTEIKLSETLRLAVLDSLFCMGIVKTGIMHSHDVEVAGELAAVGQPYCDRIDFNDYIVDCAARSRYEVKFEGHKYRVPEWYVKESGLFKHYDKLTPDMELYGKDTNLKKISTPDFEHNEYYELRPTVELIDLWLPDEGIVVTIPPEGMGNKILRTVEWEGDETGPFDTLCYRVFPNTIIPIPPVYTWLDLNKIVNLMAMKMKDMVEREKTIGLYNLEASDDAEQIKRAGHGELVGVSDANAVNEVTFGGFNPQSFPFLQFMLAQYSQTGPNLDVTGGRQLGAPTLGQEQMMQSNALREIDDMSNQVYGFTASLSRKLAWCLWTDPLKVIPVIKRVAGMDLKVEYSEAAKEGDFFDYSFNIEPYSMSRMNPEMRYQRLLQLVSQIVIPLLPIAATQGATLNVTELLKEAAPYLGVTNISEWWKTMAPPSTDVGPYQPVQGEVTGETERPKSGQGRDQFGSSEASRNSNKSQMATREGK
jgi:hypothetical protein